MHPMPLHQVPFANRLFCSFIAVALACTGRAQFLAPGDFVPAPEGYFLSVDRVATHEEGVLEGMSTYRVFLNCLHPTDYLSSCSGDQTAPLIIESTSGGWFNSAANSNWSALGVNAMFFGAFPELAYDSFLTIGAENSETPAGQHPQSVWGDVDATSQFVGLDGANVVVDDATGGAWFLPFPGAEVASSHAGFAGDDLRILIMQITTSGMVSGQVQLQAFMEADQDAEWRDVMTFASNEQGCTDVEACNYNPDAIDDDGSCTFPGCLEPSACNFAVEAGCDGVECTFPLANFDCEGNCAVGVDCAGECGGNAVLDECGVCHGDGSTCVDDCCEADLVWNVDLTDQVVQCVEDLPTSCEAFLAGQDVYALNPCSETTYSPSCTPFVASLEQDYRAGTATTAKLDPTLAPDEYGFNDGAVQVYGLSALGYASSDYFVEDLDEPLTWVHYPSSGTARLTGRVRCRDNADEWFELDAVYGQEMNAAAWLAENSMHNLVVADDPMQMGFQPCAVVEENASVFVMNETSFLRGGGDLEGSFLHIEHMPATLNKRFQLGEGMNNHNCNFGFGGWFRWSGLLAHAEGQTELVQGMSGDIVVDLEVVSFEVDCGEFVEIQLRAIDDDCARFVEQTVRIEREDSTPPTLMGAPQDVVVDCNNVPVAPSLESLEVGDNCDGPLEVSFEEILLDESPLAAFWPSSLVNTSLDDCPSTYTLLRKWTVRTACFGAVAPELAPFQQTVHEQYVTVLDEEAPSIATPPTDLVVPCDTEGLDGLVDAWLAIQGGAVATDNCDASSDVVWSHGVVSFEPGCGNTAQADVWFSAADCAGNVAMVSASILVVDNEPPTLICEDVSIDCTMYSPDDAYIEIPTDACGAVDLVWSDAPLDAGCGSPYGSYLRTYTATDDCGLSSTCTQTIVLVNDVAPTLLVGPSDLELDCASNVQDALDAWLEANGGAEAVDDCGAVVWSNNMPEDWVAECVDEGLSVEFVASDGCGNSVSATATVSVVDDEAPTLTAMAQDLVLSCTDDAEAEVEAWLENQGGAQAVDACSVVAWENDWTPEGLIELPSGCSQGEGLVVTFEASDACGNAVETTASIFLVDEDAPTFVTVPVNETVACDAVIEFEPAVVEDACGEVMLTEMRDTIPGDCPQAFTLVRTFMAMDACGNHAWAQQLIEVVDDMGPVFLPYESTVYVPCDAFNPQDAGQFPLEATDGCGEVTLEVEASCNSGGCLWSYLRVWTATDACGNQTEVEQYVVLVDSVPPVVDAPDDLVIELSGEDCLDDVSGLDTGSPTYSDNCGTVDCWGTESLTVWFEDGPFTSQCEGDDAMPEGSKTWVRTWYVADACGNVGSDAQTLSVIDSTAPMAEVEDVEVPCSSYDAGTGFGGIVAFDNCDSNVHLSFTDGEAMGEGAEGCQHVERRWVMVDDCGNADTVFQTLVLVDDVPPIALGDMEVLVDCWEYDSGQSYVEALDNCAASGDVAVEFEDYPLSGGCVLPHGRYLRLYTLTDPCGNQGEFTQFITLQDSTPPSLVMPDDLVLNCEEDLVFGEVSATDDCGGEVLVEESLEYVLGDCPGNYTVLRTVTAMDHCDNDTTLVQTVVVEDVVGPSLMVPEDQSVACPDDVVWLDAVAEDACGLDTVYVEDMIQPGSCPGDYTLVRTFVAVDQCGNETLGTQTIEVSDTVPPTFLVVPSDTLLSCADPMLDALPMPVAEDNCGLEALTVSSTVEDGDCPNAYVLTRLFEAVDACGNVAQAMQTVEVFDDEAPVLVGNDVTTVECAAEDAGALLQAWLDDHGGLSVTDNCTPADAVVWSFPEGIALSDSCDANGQVTVEFVATDACGNAATKDATFALVDNTPPYFISTGGLVNHQVQEVCCEGIHGATFVPEPVLVTWGDHCASGGEAVPEETCIGENCPTEDVLGWCDVTTPAPLADGQTCDNYDPHSMRLFNFAGSEYYTTLEGRVAKHVDGTMTYTMTVVATDDPDAGWTLTNRYAAPMTWQAWVDQPGLQGYKSDCGLGDHTDWLYTTLTEGVALGWGAYEGDSLSFFHQPTSGYFGFQIGEGANNKNGAYGFSGWVYYTGTFGGVAVNGSGDVFGDLDCCLPYDIQRDYVVEDCSGNQSQFSYTVRLTGGVCDEDNQGTSIDQDAGPTVAKDLVTVVSLQPNPTNADATLLLATDEASIDVTVEVLDLGGALLATPFSGPVVLGWDTSVQVPSSGLESGVYLIQVRAKGFVTTKKLLVTH